MTCIFFSLFLSQAHDNELHSSSILPQMAKMFSFLQSRSCWQWHVTFKVSSWIGKLGSKLVMETSPVSYNNAGQESDHLQNVMFLLILLYPLFTLFYLYFFPVANLSFLMR